MVSTMSMISKGTAAISLLLRFLRAVVVSGLQTVWVVVRTGTGSASSPQAGFVRFRFAPMSAQGAAILGCMVSLTPGTTVIDIDMSAREMVVHMLDATAARKAVETIRREFEPGLVAWFGEPR